ncbi:inositol-tetrakisphosphate 1-kinase-like isoform X2 [Neocloeon triangulifer]|uniref:inositol-tetrakisphosphate 1-kinase-like isoform X2 n=1 Tax=Neocloeon triangulifer TaxID=2078957 RepID=UPI00286EB78E|nr:inositol-tetrakisphosphate 1-kinase-like isoform X2 [Neocloeon triangulifer]
MLSTKEPSRQVIGYWMSEKKSQKLNWSEFASVCKENGLELVKLDLNEPLEMQGPFTAILHKLTDIIALAMQGDAKATRMMENIESFLDAHPEVAVIDPLPNVRQLLDRSLSYSVIHSSDLGTIDVFTPTYVELTSSDVQENIATLSSAGVKFPFVCKPLVAHGSSNAHKMSIIFNEEGVSDCKPPCVAQTFINHNAVLYKIFSVGDDHYVVERPSLKNFYSCDQETIHFDSHDVSKADSTSALSILDPEDSIGDINMPDPEKFARIAEILNKELGMALLGIDVVLENGTNRYAIIDINAYPGYDGYPNFFGSLLSCIQKTIADHSSHLAEVSQEGNPDDSGFDTGYSSDEKKKNLLRGRVHKKTMLYGPGNTNCTSGS